MLVGSLKSYPLYVLLLDFPLSFHFQFFPCEFWHTIYLNMRILAVDILCACYLIVAQHLVPYNITSQQSSSSTLLSNFVGIFLSQNSWHHLHFIRLALILLFAFLILPFFVLLILDTKMLRTLELPLEHFKSLPSI